MIEYVREICIHCGNLRSVCSDPERPLFPQRSMCYVTAVKDLTARKVRAKYDKEPSTDELHPTDGMTVWASPEDLTPDDTFV